MGNIPPCLIDAKIKKIFMQMMQISFAETKKNNYLCTRNKEGAIAQLVEQRTENPCVPGSIPGGTTKKRLRQVSFLFIYPARP